MTQSGAGEDSGRPAARMKRRFWSLDLYVGREYTFAFLVSFLFFFFIFFLNQLLLLAQDILAKHVRFTDVVLLIIYSLPAIIAISFPFASLVGALMAIGRLSSDNEILALQASGVSHARIFTPIFVLGFLFSLVSFVMNDYFLPLGTINFGKLYTKILYTNPQLELEPYSIKHYQDSVMVTGRVEGTKISDLVIFDTTADKNQRVITAKGASLQRDGSRLGIISLKLDRVFSLSVDAKRKDQFTYSEASQMLYNILLSDINVSIHPPTAREMSSVDVYRIILHKEAQLAKLKKAKEARVILAAYDLQQSYAAASLQALQGTVASQALRDLTQAYGNWQAERAQPVIDRSLSVDRIEFNRKFSVPFACVVFVVFAFPAGLLTRRSGRSVGFGIGLFVSILYWGMLVAGQTLGYRMDYSPALSMWLPNLVILVAGIALFAVRLRR